jgi:histidinol-phosphatase (PHP family)
MRPADYHTHNHLCRHASGEPLDYARAAAAAGLDEIGLSDHNPSPALDDGWRMAMDELPRYLDLAAEAIETSPADGGPVVRLGLECDWLASERPWLEELSTLAPWDYLIGSVHYIAPGWDVDNPRWIGRISETGVAETWDLYWKCYEEAIRSRLFDIMGHPDLVKKFGHRPPGDLRRYYEPVIHALAETGVAIELNTAGWRKDCNEAYPAREFLELAAVAGIPLVISSDAHAPQETGHRFHDAVRLAMESGFTRLARFANRHRTLHPITEPVARP